MRHMATYYSPGSLFAEKDTIELANRDVNEAVTRAPSHAFAFTLHDLHEVDFEYDEDRFTVIPKAQNKSGRYYLGGEIFKLDDPALAGDEYRVLRANLEQFEGARAIRTRHGNWQPFEETDELVELVGASA